MKYLETWYPYVLGYGFAVFLAGYFVGLVVDALWRGLGWKGAGDSKFRFNAWLPAMVGMVERTLYVSALLLGQGGFIGLWLALKVAGQWKYWNEVSNSGGRVLHGRAVYQVFLLGNGFSIIFSLVGFKIIEWLQSGDIFFATSVTAISIGTTLVIKVWMRHKEAAS